jgi:hypothetical protein
MDSTIRGILDLFIHVFGKSIGRSCLVKYDDFECSFLDFLISAVLCLLLSTFVWWIYLFVRRTFRSEDGVEQEENGSDG